MAGNALPLILLAGAAFFLMGKKGSPVDQDEDTGPGWNDELHDPEVREHVEAINVNWSGPKNGTTLRNSAVETVQKFFPDWTLEDFHAGDAEAVSIWNGVKGVYGSIFGIPLAPFRVPSSGPDTSTRDIQSNNR